MTRDENNPIYRQYLLEKELAEILKQSERSKRRRLYSKVYDRFYDEVPEELKKNFEPSKAQRSFVTDLKLKIINPLIPSNECILVEIGSGNCDFTKGIASKVTRVISIEATDKLTNERHHPDNVTFKIAEAPPYDIQTESIDIVFSSHFIEHLHPEDAIDHMKEVYRILRNGGKYLCLTPNILYGPHDISQHFGDKVATGLHLKEYSYLELGRLGKKVGFKNITAIQKLGSKPSKFAYYFYSTFERGLLSPLNNRHVVEKLFFKSYKKPFRPLEQIKIVFHK